MTIASELTKLNTNLTNSYTAVSDKGGTLPQARNFDNLATAIESIPSGGSAPVIESLNVTPTTSSQTISAPSGTDGYSPVNVAAVTAAIDANIVAGNIKKDVQILDITGTYEGSGGGGIGIPREVKNSVYQMPTENFTFSLPNDATDVGTRGLSNAFYGCTGLTSVDLSSLTTISGSQGLSNAFRGCSALTSVDLSSLTTISGYYGLSSAFYGCKKLTDIYFRALTTSSFSTYKNQFYNMMIATDKTTTHKIHFPSNMQSTISGLTGYPAFGGTSGYVVLAFDLPATS